jgi:pyruvate kinase
MLSGETAAGCYPEESVAVMAGIAQATEPHVLARDVVRRLERTHDEDEISTEDLISLSIFGTAEALSPAAIVAPTLSGATARRVSRFRLPAWIIAVSPHESTCQALQFSYGVQAVHETERPANWTRYAFDWLERHGVGGDLALLTRGSATFHAGGTNHIEIVDLRSPPEEVSIW